MFRNLQQNLVGITAAALLIGSFPARDLIGQDACDIMRLIGFVLMFAFSIYVLAKEHRHKQRR